MRHREGPVEPVRPHDTRSIGIHVELSVHSAAGPRRGVIVLEAGGPGTAISQTKGGYFDALLGDLPETFDIVLIDQRGVGKSEAIDCQELEQAVTTRERYDAAACLPPQPAVIGRSLFSTTPWPTTSTRCGEHSGWARSTCSATPTPATTS